MSDSMIRDISLSDNGEQRIRWVAKFMPALNALREEFIKDQTFKGKTIVMSIHLEAKTAYLALTLKAARCQCHLYRKQSAVHPGSHCSSSGEKRNYCVCMAWLHR